MLINEVTLHHSWMDDYEQMGKTSRYAMSHSGPLSLANPPWLCIVTAKA